MSLHMVAIQLPGLPGFVMFPVAFLFYEETLGEREGRGGLSGGVVAALIQVLRFPDSGEHPDQDIQSGTVHLVGRAGCVAVFSRKTEKYCGLCVGFSMGFLWRAAFLVYLFLISLIDLPAALVTAGLRLSLRFLIFGKL